MFIADFAEIYTDDGTGVRSTYAGGAALGLISGVIVLMTGRNTITTATGDTTRTNWVKDLLLKGSGDFLPSIIGDFVEAGGFAKYSAMSLSVVNAAAWLLTLRAHGIYLNCRKVVYYRGTSTDGVTWAMERRWTGVIDLPTFDENTVQIQCVNASFDIFKNLPTKSAPTDPFEGALEGDKERLLPILMGRIAQAQLTSLQKAGNKLVISVIGGDELYTGAANSYFTSGGLYFLRLKTYGVKFTENDPSLVDKFVSVVAGSMGAQFVGIAGNTESIYASGGFQTTLTLKAPLDETAGAFVAWVSGDSSAGTAYFQVVDLGPLLIAAGRDVYDYLYSVTGRPRVSVYDNTKKSYRDVSEIVNQFSKSNIKGSGFPGFSVAAKTADANGALLTYAPIVPSAAKVVAVTGWLGEDVPAVGADAPLLYDRLEGAGYEYTLTAGVAGAFNASVSFDIKFPHDESEKDFSELYILVDMSHKYASGSSPVLVTANAFGIDIYDRQVADAVPAGRDIYNGALGSTYSDIHFLNREYFNLEGDNTKFYTGKAVFKISDLIGNAKNTTAYNKIRFKMTFFSSAAASTYTVKIQEVGIVAQIATDVTSDPVYAGLIGEKYESTWDARVTPGLPILNIVEMLEALIRKYDTPGDFWEASTAYVVGEKVRATADTGHIFVCTTAGTTAASEPAWTDTAEATYTDGSATWKEWKEIPIDKVSMDALYIARSNWFAGMTITDRKPSEQYYKTMLAQMFALGFINKDGNLQVTSWLDNQTPLVTFDASNIYPGTLGKMTPTPTSRISNEILIPFDWNPAAKKFNRRIFITKIDQPAFPDELEFDRSKYVSLGAHSIASHPLYAGVYVIEFTTTLAHGLSNSDYILLEGNAEGYDLAPVRTAVTGTFTFSVAAEGFFSGASTSGALYKVGDATPLWKSFASGYRSYGMARAHWQQCHDAYLIDMTINRLPEELGACYNYIDPYATDENGVLLWPDLDVGDDHPAALLAGFFASWTPWPKDQNTWETFDNATMSALNFGDCVALNDAAETQGAARIGWIHEKTALAAAGDMPERFRFGVTFKPEQLVEDLIIDENGATDIIDENTATNIYDEN